MGFAVSDLLVRVVSWRLRVGFSGLLAVAGLSFGLHRGHGSVHQPFYRPGFGTPAFSALPQKKQNSGVQASVSGV